MPKDPTKKPSATTVSESQELENQIRERAYELYEARGREDGHDREDCLREPPRPQAKFLKIWADRVGRTKLPRPAS
jgi:hypothetical protein